MHVILCSCLVHVLVEYSCCPYKKAFLSMLTVVYVDENVHLLAKIETHFPVEDSVQYTGNSVQFSNLLWLLLRRMPPAQPSNQKLSLSMGGAAHHHLQLGLGLMSLAEHLERGIDHHDPEGQKRRPEIGGRPSSNCPDARSFQRSSKALSGLTSWTTSGQSWIATSTAG